MKVSVSIPDAILRAADELAQRMGVSRSRLSTIALERLVWQHDPEHDDEAITAKINEVLAHEPSSVDPLIQS